MKNLIISGKIIALISFVIGTCLFSLFLYFDQSETIGMIGFYFVVIALITNSILFFILFISSAIYENYRLELLKTCGIMLLNIPIAILYVHLIVNFPTNTIPYQETKHESSENIYIQ